MALISKKGSLYLQGIYFLILHFNFNRAHIVTALQKRVAMRVREIRNDTIWINGEDVAMAFKPMKMGLLMAHLVEDTWEEFLEKYMRVMNTFEELYKIKMNDEEIKTDLDYIKQL